ncbi:ABC transporter substrate-binding protein [Mycobacterium deserti]|uniref:ABC transporter substrate-binding protein n=1 Tax=Mycobacterium deserti TaxID=2978347 RepID=A0ABT2M4J5_9MYCO|nr:ABC transporter substrate-binding protein [Mycobacterium deserti]MCT7657188.1 ABC transporter substrate-binding protein [Mycobacterium deserti]
MTYPEDINADVSAGPALKVGVCIDFPIVDVHRPFLDGIRLAFDEAYAAGIIDRPARLIVKEAEGLPRGDANAVVRVWQELVDEGCVASIGPMISDNCLAVKEHMDTAAQTKIATLTWAGTDDQYNEYMFGFGNGSLPEEPFLIAESIADRGLKTVGVVFERAAPGYGYAENFADACRREGLEIVHSEGVGQVHRDMGATVANMMTRKPDALAYFGFGLPGVEMNAALSAAGWDPPRYMCAAFILCYVVPQYMTGLKGWIGVDQFDEENTVGAAMLSRFEKRFGYRQDNCVPTLAYDCGQGLALGIGHASTLTPMGVMRGLEKVKALPSATGGPGTRISFGKWNRRAWHGVDYLVMREINDDATGTRLVARFRR